MKLKVIIVDDEADAITVLENIININKTDYEIVAKTTNPVDAVGLIVEHKPDVVFIDIEMPELDGFQVLKSIPDINFEVIFATAYENYAVKAIKENALDYILKPATIPEVLEALEKAKKRKLDKKNSFPEYETLLDNVNNKRLSKIKIPTSSGFEFVETSDLISLEADGPYTTAYFKNSDKLVISKSIKQLEELLETNSFFRLHRSFIVNVEYIKRFERDRYSVVMSDGSVIPLSRRRYDAFMDFLDNQET